MDVTRVLPAAALALCAAVSACRNSPDTGSTTQTLGNLAAGQGDALALNDCTGKVPMDQTTFQSLRTKGQIQVSDDLAETLRTTLADIKPVLDLYFGAGYQLQVRLDAADACKNGGHLASASFDATQTAGGQTFPSCWMQNFYVDDATAPGGQRAVSASEAQELTTAGGNTVREQFVAVVASTPTAIHQSTIRVLGLALFQRLGLLEKQGQNLVVGQASPQLTQTMDSLTIALLQTEAGKTGALAAVRSLLPSDPGTWTAAGVPALWASWRQAHPAAATDLDGIAAGESFDSYYHCPATRQAMQTSFPASFAIFDQQVAPELNGAAAQAQAAPATGLGLVDAPRLVPLTQAAAPSQGLALCGGGLFPNLGCGGLLDGLGLGADNGFPILSGIGSLFGFGDDDDDGY